MLRSTRLLVSRASALHLTTRHVIGTSHASQRDDEVFSKRLSGAQEGIAVSDHF